MTDRLSDEDLPIIEDLGAWLRRERERAGVSLETIATRTKVARTLLEGARAQRRLALAERHLPARLRPWLRLAGRPRPRLRRRAVRPRLPRPAGVCPITAVGPGDRACRRPVRQPARGVVAADARARGEPLAGSPGPSRRRHHRPDGARSRWRCPSGLLGGLSLFWIVLAVVAVLYLTVGTLVLGTTPGLWMMQCVGSQPLGARRMPWGKAHCRARLRRRPRRGHPRRRGQPAAGLEFRFRRLTPFVSARARPRTSARP